MLIRKISFFVYLLSATKTFALSTFMMTEEVQIQKSDFICAVQVSGISSVRREIQNRKGTLVQSVAKAKVLQCFKPENTETPELKIYLPGGEIIKTDKAGKVTTQKTEIVGAPTLQLGQTAVVFLTKRENELSLPSWAHPLQVFKDGEEYKIVTKPSVQMPTTMSFEEYKKKIQSTLKNAKPKNR